MLRISSPDIGELQRLNDDLGKLERKLCLECLELCDVVVQLLQPILAALNLGIHPVQITRVPLVTINILVNIISDRNRCAGQNIFDTPRKTGSFEFGGRQCFVDGLGDKNNTCRIRLAIPMR